MNRGRVTTLSELVVAVIVTGVQPGRPPLTCIRAFMCFHSPGVGTIFGELIRWSDKRYTTLKPVFTSIKRVTEPNEQVTIFIDSSRTEYSAPSTHFPVQRVLDMLAIFPHVATAQPLRYIC